MTGDNNGRWAGNYSWPDSHTLYMSHVRDAIRMLRIHPSLLFWNGCNECYPASRIWYGEPLAASVEELDPGRFYIASSMSNYTNYSSAFALAPKDGPYGFLDARQ